MPTDLITKRDDPRIAEIRKAIERTRNTYGYLDSFTVAVQSAISSLDAALERESLKMTRGRWMAGVYVLDDSVVGTVQKGASGDWFAYGCLGDWEDTPLRSWPTEDKAKRAVEDWIEENMIG